MFHCEPQYNEILLAALMVTADMFKNSVLQKTPQFLFSVSVPPKSTVVSPLLAQRSVQWASVGMAGDGFVFVLAAEFLAAPQISQEMQVVSTNKDLLVQRVTKVSQRKGFCLLQTNADDTGWLCIGVRTHGRMAMQLFLSLNSGLCASTANCLILGPLLNFWAGHKVSTWWSGQAVGAAFGKW